jgi:hypothetical protein
VGILNWGRGKASDTDSGQDVLTGLDYGETVVYTVTGSKSYRWSNIRFAPVAGVRAQVIAETATTFKVEVHRYAVDEGGYVSSSSSSFTIAWGRIGGIN